MTGDVEGGLEMQDPSEIIVDVIATIFPGIKMTCTTNRVSPWLLFGSR